MILVILVLARINSINKKHKKITSLRIKNNHNIKIRKMKILIYQILKIFLRIRSHQKKKIISLKILLIILKNQLKNKCKNKQIKKANLRKNKMKKKKFLMQIGMISAILMNKVKYLWHHRNFSHQFHKKNKIRTLDFLSLMIQI